MRSKKCRQSGEALMTGPRPFPSWAGRWAGQTALALRLHPRLPCSLGGTLTRAPPPAVPGHRERLHPGLDAPRRPPSSEVSSAPQGAQGEPRSCSTFENCLSYFLFLESCFCEILLSFHRHQLKEFFRILTFGILGDLPWCQSFD